MTRAEILLTINSNLEGIRKANEGFLDLQRTMRNTGSEASKVGKQMSGFSADLKSSLMAGVGLGAGFTAGAAAANVMLGAMRQVTGSIKDTVSEGVRFNATLEQSKLGVASVLKQFNPDKYQSFSSAIADSEVIIDQLKKKALETAATFEELLVAYQGTAGAMASAGIPLGKQVNLIVNISQAMAALGIRTEEMRQEATALMMGNIDRNARLAQTLGITGEQIRVVKDQGKLYEFLAEKLKAFGDAAVLAQGNITVLESNLKDAKTQVAADQTKELAGAYKELLKSLTELVKSDAYKDVLHFMSMSAGGALKMLKGVIDFFSRSESKTTPNARMVAGNTRDYTAFKEKADSVRSDEDIAAAKDSGREALRWMNSTANTLRVRGNNDPEAQVAVQNLIATTSSELELLEKQGKQRIENNRKADEAAKIEQLAAKWAKEAAEAREDGVKKYAAESERTQARIRETAKSVNPAMYIGYLNADKKSLEAQLQGPDSRPERYLGAKDGGDAEKRRAAEAAALAFQLEIQGKLAALEKEILATQEEQARKAKTEREQKVHAQVRYLQVKAQEGTIAEKIAALDAERNALDKTSLNYKADALSIDFRIAKLKDEAAAHIRSEAAKAEQRNKQAEVQEIRDNTFLTAREKREKLHSAFKREQLGIAERIKAAEALVNSQDSGTATKAQAQSELESLKTRRDVGLPSDLAQNQPLSMVGETQAALVAMQDTFRTVATSIADVMGGTINGISNGIFGLLRDTMSFGDAARAVWVGIGESAARVVADMAAQWLVKHTLMAAWSSIFDAEQAATHAAAEGAKTTATAVGASARTGIRVGETTTDVTLTAVKTGAHVTGEATKTSSTLFGGMIRIGVAIKEAIASVFTAGLGALQAMASIPYVGPILAVAAMGAVIAAGMAIVKGISKGFKKGGYTGAGDPNEVAGSVHYEEVVFNRDDVRRHGGVAAVEALRVRGGGLMDRGGAVEAVAVAAPVEAQGGGGGQQINQAFFGNQQDAEQWLYSQRGRRMMTDFVKGIQYELT